MDWVFRKIKKPEVPAPGELWIRLPEEAQGRAAALASLALTEGPGAFLQGPRPIERLVLPVEGLGPTLDDMLAAAVLQRRLAGKALPQGLASFAHYAELVRRGLYPSDLPAEETVEAVYQALRNERGADLTDPLVRQHFVAGWERLFGRLLQAAEAGEDPCQTALFAGDSRFAEEKAYLRRDQQVYRQDLARGERWRVRLPGGPPAGGGLFLRQPKSLLFKHWCRQDVEAPGEAGYLLLVVDWGKDNWLLSTNPVHQLSLAPLAALLQEAEVSADPARAEADPWFDGKRFNHTLIAAPRGGTRLTQQQFLRVVRQWAGARAVKPRSPGLKKLLLPAGLAAASLLIAALLWWFIFRPRPTAPDSFDEHEIVQVLVNGNQRGLDLDRDEPVGVAFSRACSLDLAKGPTEVVFVEKNAFAEPRPVELWVTLVPRQPAPASLPRLTIAADVNGSAINFGSINPNGGHYETKHRAVQLRPNTQNPITFTVHNHGEDVLPVDFRVSWQDDHESVCLWLLCVGAGRYKNEKLNLHEIPANDARELQASLKNHGRGLFKEVKAKLLCDEEATQEKLLQALLWVQGAKEHDLVFITFSGHGDKHPTSEDFYLLPHDFSPPENALLIDATRALNWTILWNNFLSQMRCRVIVAMDACHSGAIRLPDRRANEAFNKDQARNALAKFASGRQKRGVVLIAACTSGQKALQRANLKHGVLSKALLDCINGKKSGVLSLAELWRYAETQVPLLAGNDQAVVVTQTGNISYAQIPIALGQAPQ
jgi:hypothetical protein